MVQRPFVAVGMALLLSLGGPGCIGTDLVDEGSGSELEPYVEIDPGDSVLLEGDQLQFTARYFDATGLEVPAAVTWRSSNPAVASISDGLLSAISAGQAMIVATAEGVESEPVMVTVVENDGSVARIVVTPDTAEVRTGNTVQFSAEAFDISGGSVTTSFEWTSSDQSVATVDAAGVATAVGIGQASIVARAGGIASRGAVLISSGETRSGPFESSPGTRYSASGTATLRQLEGGGLRLEFGNDFSIDSGPGLVVFLSNSSTVTSTSVRIDDLKSSLGAQTYPVPNTVGFNSHAYVVIHCVPFNVTFGFARLR